MNPIQPHLESDLFMENLRRQSESMTRDELLLTIHHLSHAYSMQRAATNWAICEAANYGRST